MKSKRGFASMTPERIRELASRGGRSVPKEKRAFAQKRALASDAGKVGGKKNRLGDAGTKVLTVRLPSPWVEDIDRWRRDQKTIPRYSDFLREAVAEKLSRLKAKQPQSVQLEDCKAV